MVKNIHTRITETESQIDDIERNIESMQFELQRYKDQLIIEKKFLEDLKTIIKKEGS